MTLTPEQLGKIEDTPATPEFEGVLKLHARLKERDKRYYGLPEPSQEAQPLGEMACPQCGNAKDDPREDSIERMLVCRDSFHSQQVQPLPAAALTHGRNCAAWTNAQGDECGERCTCGLQWRIQLQTEQTMHAAWRKRAEEAEATLAAGAGEQRGDTRCEWRSVGGARCVKDKTHVDSHKLGVFIGSQEAQPLPARPKKYSRYKGEHPAEEFFYLASEIDPLLAELSRLTSELDAANEHIEALISQKEALITSEANALASKEEQGGWIDFNRGVEAAAVAVEYTWEGWDGVVARIRREKLSTPPDSRKDSK